MTMTHAEIELQDVVDRYVRGTLDAQTADAFEAHYFACDRCFADVQALETLRAALRESVDAGELNAEPVAVAARAVPPSRGAWLPVAASVGLAAGLAWMTFVRVPALQQQLNEVTADRARLAAAPPAPPPATVPTASATPNVALLFLSAERGADVPTVTLGPGTPALVLAIDAGPAPSGRARLTVARDGGPTALMVDDLVRSDAGVWTVHVPSQSVTPGVYRLRLVDATGGRMIGEYLIRVR